jgi:hypothetical protein
MKPDTVNAKATTNALNMAISLSLYVGLRKPAASSMDGILRRQRHGLRRGTPHPRHVAEQMFMTWTEDASVSCRSPRSATDTTWLANLLARMSGAMKEMGRRR